MRKRGVEQEGSIKIILTEHTLASAKRFLFAFAALVVLAMLFRLGEAPEHQSVSGQVPIAANANDTINETLCLNRTVFTDNFRYLVYYRGLLIKNSSRLELFDVDSDGYSITVSNYLSVPIKVAVDYQRVSERYDIDELVEEDYEVPAESALTQFDEKFRRMGGCNPSRCAISIVGSRLLSTKITHEKVNEPLAETVEVCE